MIIKVRFQTSSGCNLARGVVIFRLDGFPGSAGIVFKKAGPDAARTALRVRVIVDQSPRGACWREMEMAGMDG